MPTSVWVHGSATNPSLVLGARVVVLGKVPSIGRRAWGIDGNSLLPDVQSMIAVVLAAEQNK